jgi:hypothetical protein
MEDRYEDDFMLHLEYIRPISNMISALLDLLLKTELKIWLPSKEYEH